MPCDHVDLPGGGVAIVCRRGRRSAPPSRRCRVCDMPDTMVAMKLCDGVVDSPEIVDGMQRRRRTTCDAPICVYHALHVEPDTDLCPRHADSR